MTFEQMLISIGGVALTVLIAWWLGERAPPALSAEAAAAIADAAFTGFETEAVYIDADSKGALVVAPDGRSALLKQQGVNWAARLVPPGSMTVTGDEVAVDIAEPMFRPVRLRVGESAARDLALRLEPAR